MLRNVESAVNLYRYSCCVFSNVFLDNWHVACKLASPYDRACVKERGMIDERIDSFLVCVRALLILQNCSPEAAEDLIF